MSDLSAAKVGDTLVTNQYGTLSIYKVTRLTATQVICGDDRFSREGKRYGSSGYFAVYARLADEADLVKYRIQRAQQMLRTFQVNAGNLSAVEALLKEAA